MKSFPRWFPAVVALCVAAFLASVAMRSVRGSERSLGGMPLDGVARIPVSAGGRTKPLDSFARNTLLRLSGRQTCEMDGSQRSATEWLLEAWTDPAAAVERRVFRIDHPDVRSLLALPDAARTRFSWLEVAPRIEEIVRQAQLASQTPRKKQDPFQRQITDLYGKLAEYAEVRSLRAPYAVAPIDAGEEWMPLVPADPAAPPPANAAAEALGGLRAAYAARDAAQVDRRTGEYHAMLVSVHGGLDRAAALEVAMSRAEPFYQASVLYLLAFLLGCAATLLGPISPTVWRPGLARAALAVIVLAFALHTFGLAARIYLQGRPPVTNLYSSAVFIGWACIPLALAGEWFSRIGLLSLAASLVGFATLVVAHNLSASGDTMEMMQAVLDSNFWLATHVVVVTIGYSATFLAGFIAILFVAGGALTPLLRGEAMKALPRMIYGTICFAAITSFVGTVLGGIWADQSWGRFWGWDPKENGAALIVLWNLMILHARWGGMIRDRGVAALAIAGNIVTAWSWFGTNMLGVGLHSYGFMDSAVFVLVAFCLSQLALMCIAFVPAQRWRSRAA